jgi:hypothetical protein
MKHERPVAPRLVALLAVGAVAFGYPLLALFNVPGTVLGVGGARRAHRGAAAAAPLRS